jgi:hypothetical protein
VYYPKSVILSTSGFVAQIVIKTSKILALTGINKYLGSEPKRSLLQIPIVIISLQIVGRAVGMFFWLPTGYRHLFMVRLKRRQGKEE